MYLCCKESLNLGYNSYLVTNDGHIRAQYCYRGIDMLYSSNCSIFAFSGRYNDYGVRSYRNDNGCEWNYCMAEDNNYNGFYFYRDTSSIFTIQARYNGYNGFEGYENRAQMSAYSYADNTFRYNDRNGFYIRSNSDNTYYRYFFADDNGFGGTYYDGVKISSSSNNNTFIYCTGQDNKDDDLDDDTGGDNTYDENCDFENIEM